MPAREHILRLLPQHDLCMLLLIDNYDSFTHNLARYFVALGQEVKVVRNDKITCQQITLLAPRFLVFSPGPGTPDDAGITLSAIQEFSGSIPMLGVCLGHQAIGQVFGAKVIRAANIKHGKTSNITHSATPLFKHVTSPFVATRYHSLLLHRDTIPEEFTISAWCDEGGQLPEVMAIEHKHFPIFGVQFHPESLLSTSGKQILENFLYASQADNSH